MNHQVKTLCSFAVLAAFVLAALSCAQKSVEGAITKGGSSASGKDDALIIHQQTDDEPASYSVDTPRPSVL